jgi:hypothetical protein
MAAGLLGVVLAALKLSGCFGDDRSIAAVCQVWNTDGLALHNQLAGTSGTAQSNPFGTLAELGSAPGSHGRPDGQMAAVAPSDIEPSFQTLAAAFQQISQNAANGLNDPLSALAGGMAEAVSSRGAVDDVNNFLSKNCGVPGQ